MPPFFISIFSSHPFNFGIARMQPLRTFLKYLPDLGSKEVPQLCCMSLCIRMYTFSSDLVLNSNKMYVSFLAAGVKGVICPLRGVMDLGLCLLHVTFVMNSEPFK